MQIMSQGAMKAAFGIGSVRDEFVKALEIDPAFAPARSGLVQFYLMAPGHHGQQRLEGTQDIAQGPKPGARPSTPVKVLNAVILQCADKPADAERVLASVQAGGDLELVEELRGQWVGLGFGYLQAKKPVNARAVFERLARERPEQPDAHYGLGRALSDQQQWDAAIAELKLAASLPGHEALPIDYRLGIALAGQGRRGAARRPRSRATSRPTTRTRPMSTTRRSALAGLG